ncbi:MAG: hypothetical protein Q9213_004339 [Squamulea squamosa]
MALVHSGIMVVLTALLLSLMPVLGLAATIPSPPCNPKSQGQTLSLSDTACNASLSATPSANLAPMPGVDPTGSHNFHFPFHMSQGPMGLLFSDFDHRHLIPNVVVNQIVEHASEILSASLARDPNLQNKHLREQVEWPAVHQILMVVDPDARYLTYGDLRTLFRVLLLWTQQYESEECGFEIWARPGSATQRRLGKGFFLLEKDAQKLSFAGGDDD